MINVHTESLSVYVQPSFQITNTGNLFLFCDGTQPLPPENEVGR